MLFWDSETRRRKHKNENLSCKSQTNTNSHMTDAITYFFYYNVFYLQKRIKNRNINYVIKSIARAKNENNYLRNIGIGIYFETLKPPLVTTEKS